MIEGSKALIWSGYLTHALRGYPKVWVGWERRTRAKGFLKFGAPWFPKEIRLKAKVDLKKLGGILKKYSPEKGQSALMPLLQEIQEAYGYLPAEAFEGVGKHLNVPLSHIYGVVTFYAQFSLVPRGRNIIKVCAGTACHVQGARDVLDAIKSALSVESGETTSDLKFTLEVVRCLGTCFLAPVIMINRDYYGDLTAEKVKKILKEYK